MRGKIYNNGKISKVFLPEDVIPEGWVPGRTKAEKETILEKRKKTNLEKYGVEHVSQDKGFRKRVEESNLKKYGTKSPMQSKEVQEKTKQTNLERYGTEYSFQSEVVKDKIKKTMVSKYGVEHALQSDSILECMKSNNIEKYGVENVLQLEEVKEKIRKTSLQNYGTEHPMQSEEIKQRVKNTNIEKYGVECTLQSLESIKKKEETWTKHYGVSHPSKSEEVKEKIRQTNLVNLGVEYPMQSKEVKEKARKTSIQHYGYSYPHQSSEVLQKTSQTCQERYGVPWACMRPEAKQGYSNDSKVNQEFAHMLDDAGILYEREFPLGSYSYDFKINSILIEIDPTATHNTLWNPFDKSGGISIDYHKTKSNMAKSSGLRCVHVFDWDSREKIINTILRSGERVYARNTNIVKVSSEETSYFMNEHHLQGNCKGQDICIGLCQGDNLISIMTFGKPRYNKNYDYELLRYCSSSNVVGGAEKIFKSFIRNYKPQSVISYCDMSKFSGRVYKKLGFIEKCDGTPSRHWYNPNTGKHITDNLLRQRGYDQLFHTNYGKGTSNEELMVRNGFTSVYDCGQATYVWKETLY